MSTGFTIDDVRDTLTADVTRLLGRIETTARDILERKHLGSEAVPLTLPLFQAIGDHGHAIYGTARLVSAHSLAHSAARIETLAQRGQDELGKALHHLGAAREIAMTLVGGATDMLAMLSLELDARPDEALSIADSWRLRVEELVRGLVNGSVAGEPAHGSNGSVAGEPANGNTSVASQAFAANPAPSATALARDPIRTAAAHPAVDSGWGDFDDVAEPPIDAAQRLQGHAGDTRLRALEAFSFAASEAEPAASVASAAIDAELEEIFAVEARTTLAGLDDKLAALRTALDDRGLLKAAERAFHTLKGAAATVGLVEVSQRASELQIRAELLVDAGHAPSAETIAELTRDTDALRQLAGVPGPQLHAPDAPPPQVVAPALATRPRAPSTNFSTTRPQVPGTSTSLAETQAVAGSLHVEPMSLEPTSYTFAPSDFSCAPQ